MLHRVQLWAPHPGPLLGSMNVRRFHTRDRHNSENDLDSGLGLTIDRMTPPSLVIHLEIDHLGDATIHEKEVDIMEVMDVTTSRRSDRARSRATRRLHSLATTIETGRLGVISFPTVNLRAIFRGAQKHSSIPVRQAVHEPILMREEVEAGVEASTTIVTGPSLSAMTTEIVETIDRLSETTETTEVDFRQMTGIAETDHFDLDDALPHHLLRGVEAVGA